MSKSRYDQISVNTKSSSSREHYSARIAGSFVSTVVQMSLMYPLDTLGKVVMNGREPILKAGQNVFKTAQLFNKTVFGNAADLPFFVRYLSLYRGFATSAVLKLGRSSVAYAAQPLFAELLQCKYESKLSNPMAHAISGSAVGLAELIILPADNIKVKKQSNPLFAQKSFSTIFKQESWGSLFSAAPSTVVRNVNNASLVFGVSEFIRHQLTNGKKQPLSIWQEIFAAATGAIIATIASNPADVVKTRVQNQSSLTGEIKSDWQVAKQIYSELGIRGFGKGIGTKLATYAPRVTMMLTLTPQVSARLHNFFFSNRPENIDSRQYDMVRPSQR